MGGKAEPATQNSAKRRCKDRPETGHSRSDKETISNAKGAQEKVSLSAYRNKGYARFAHYPEIRTVDKGRQAAPEAPRSPSKSSDTSQHSTA